MSKFRVGDKGLELRGYSSGNTLVSESDTVKYAAFDEGLAEVVAAWPGLTPEQRQDVLRIVTGAESNC